MAAVPAERPLTVVEPPAPAWAERLFGLYRLWDREHATGAWRDDLSRRISTAQSGAIDRFYLVPYNDQVAAALDVTRSASLAGPGLVHRVFAHPTQRRKGLSRCLFDAVRAEFRGSGGRLLLLVAPEAGVARRFYGELGFHEIVRGADGEILFGWAARGRHVREAALRFMRHEPVRWREANAGDWAGLVLFSCIPHGDPGRIPATLRDVEWIEVFERLASPKPGFGLEVGESRHGYVVAVKTEGAAPAWLEALSR
jgi:GNAT superfamily N-acetyltransferase